MAALIASCSDGMEDLSERRPVLVDETSISNVVSLDNVKTLVAAQNAATATRGTGDFVADIKCLENVQHDTLLYVCEERGGGWTIYSSDKRTPAIVAQSESGSFSHAMQNEALATWIETMKEDMEVIRKASDRELNFSKQEIDENLMFWEAIASPDDFVKKCAGQVQTKGRGDFDLEPEIIGHYELFSSTTFEEVYDSIGRLTETDWGQHDRYNAYCPLKSDGSDRAPAGCVAIAGAQMLFFLHKKFNVPECAPSTAYCNSTIADYPNYNWGQSDYNSTIWSQMKTDSIAAAPLIADIGRRVNMRYGDDGSSARVVDLKNNVFAYYGINCDFSTYNDHLDSLCSNLLSGIPVILKAQEAMSNNGHAFIADKYKRVRTITRNTYRWIYDRMPQRPDGTLIPLPCIPDKIEDIPSSSRINMIGINWGEGPFFLRNEEWYTLLGKWIMNFDLSYTNWNVNREMMYNFTPINK